MNRHERRKSAKVMQMERREFSPDEIANMGSMCAWDGCGEHFQGRMPDGWRSLLLFWSAQPVDRIAEIRPETFDRDAVLCPAHARELDGQLKDLGRKLMGEVAGSA